MSRKINPGKEAENFKENILPLLCDNINITLKKYLKDSPAFILVLFETGSGSRTHYRYGEVENPEDIPDVLRKLATLMEFNMMKPPGRNNPLDN